MSKIGAAFLITTMMLVFAGGASATLTAEVNHGHIRIDTFYHGSTVSVKGKTDRGAELIIKITSPDGLEDLRKKGKTAGILWMNKGHIEFDKLPGLYALRTARDIKEMLREEELQKFGIGYPALEKNAELTGVSESDRGKWFSEFISYKEASKLYFVSTGQIKTKDIGGATSYYTLFDWPYQAGPGLYTVTVYAVKDGKVVESADRSLLVEQVGMVGYLADMAKNNGALYGLISIAIALGAGFGVGLIFGKGGGAH